MSSMKPKKIPKLYSVLWANMVKHRLSHGFGVEDIALQMECGADEVRFFVRKLRSENALSPLYDKMRWRMRQKA